MGMYRFPHKNVINVSNQKRRANASSAADGTRGFQRSFYYFFSLSAACSQAHAAGFFKGGLHFARRIAKIQEVARPRLPASGRMQKKNKKEQAMAQYDYLIVGAGLFGCVFAHEAN